MSLRLPTVLRRTCGSVRNAFFQIPQRENKTMSRRAFPRKTSLRCFQSSSHLFESHHKGDGIMDTSKCDPDFAKKYIESPVEERNKVIPSLMSGMGLHCEKDDMLRPSLGPVLDNILDQDDGLACLLQLRADVYALVQNDAELPKVETRNVFRNDEYAESPLGVFESSQLGLFDAALQKKLKSAFALPLLVLHAFDENDDVGLLEAVSNSDRVRPATDVSDFLRRCGGARRCFGLLHPRLPTTPLAFVNVALAETPSDDVDAFTNIETVLDKRDIHEEDEASPTVAVFYGISAVEPALQGCVALGEPLLRRVVTWLRVERPTISRYMTLSPIPQLMEILKNEDMASELESQISGHERIALEALAPGNSTACGAIVEIVTKVDDWHTNDDIAKVVRGPFERMALHALAHGRRSLKDHRCLDPVTHFHLSNGASIYRLYWLGDRSATGMTASSGLMASYRYEPETLDDNAARYAQGQRVVDVELEQRVGYLR